MVEEAGTQEGNWARRQARPGRARGPGGGFVPSFRRQVWEVDMVQPWCEKFPLELWGEWATEARGRAQGEQLGGKGRVYHHGATGAAR